jgi:hypothetical protein
LTDRRDAERQGSGASRRTITVTGLVSVGFAVVMIVVGWRGYHQPTWAFAVAEILGLSLATAVLAAARLALSNTRLQECRLCSASWSGRSH